MMPVIAIVGRPNVGKSALFNRIVGKQLAIVADIEGVTRDRNYAEVEYLGRTFTVVDTGGFDPEAKGGLLALMRRQVEVAIAEADAVIVVVDGRAGLTPLDEAVWSQVRLGRKPAYLAVNKIDNPSLLALCADFYTLGADDIYPISAETGSGVAELLERILEDVRAPQWGAEEKLSDSAIRIAIIGRPNVGKSTFANVLLGRERFLTSDVPGTTRDCVDAHFVRNGREYVLVDTAGIRRPKKVGPGLERMSIARSIKAIERAHVVALLMDAVEGVTDQDKRLASLVVEKGRGLILVMNKWDLVGRERSGNEYVRAVQQEMAFVSFAPLLLASALTKKNMGRFLPLVERVFANLLRRIPTHEINKFYREVIARHPPSISGTRTAKIRYLTQADVNPPTIVLFASGSASIGDAYLRFLQNQLRARYDFTGVPLRLVTRQG